MPRVQSIASCLNAARWTESLHVPGMRVFQAGAAATGGLQVHPLPDAAGVVIGRTFARHADALDDTPAREWRASAAESRAILASGGRWLIEHCWGNYVAILRSPGPCISIVKDPTGSLPCFVTTSDGVTLIFSYAAELVNLGLCRFTINPAYLRSRTVCGADLLRQPLNEVEQVRRGECVELDQEMTRLSSRHFLWRPQAFTGGDDAFEDVTLAARAMRASVRMSAHTWAARESRIVVRLSGGLDSSIVAGCLGDAPDRPELCCYTYFSPGAPSEERRWARAVASRLQCEHQEVPIKPEDFDLRLSLDQPLQIEPTPFLAYTLRSTIEQPIVSRSGATLVFNGDGGDSIFGAEAVRYAATEFVRRHGLRAEAIRIASAVAHYTGESTWAVLQRALRAYFGRPVADPLESRIQVSRLVSRDAMAAATSSDMAAHPWFAGDGRAMWPIVRRLGVQIASPVFYDVLSIDAAPEIVSPLCTQPVVETLLRIPLYRLFDGGRDRGLARNAFASDVPAPILARLWKDRAPGFHEQLVFMNRKFLREVFLDGVLVREGLLDRDALEEAFADRPTKSRARPAEIMGHFDTEMWVRSWESMSGSLLRRACINGD
jgi:asparagine synthase (glutamine-hydrolysing)